MLQIRAHAYSILLWVLIKINVNPYNNLLQSFSLTSFDWHYCCRWYCIAELTVCKSCESQVKQCPNQLSPPVAAGRRHHLTQTHHLCFGVSESRVPTAPPASSVSPRGHKVTVHCYLLLTCYMSSDSFSSTPSPNTHK